MLDIFAGPRARKCPRTLASEFRDQHVHGRGRSFREALNIGVKHPYAAHVRLFQASDHGLGDVMNGGKVLMVCVPSLEKLALKAERRVGEPILPQLMAAKPTARTIGSAKGGMSRIDRTLM